ncbi:Ger(x)C family spore germination protein [Brevibacillus sp. HB2.2]|uniref:Ger(x)C family spore germination protein n=1 Tax=Brevibacillus sp. HB2.2 TaxID=2738846 RepID=UPI00156ABBA2|nr:Ger(x)C family spore germination protein [Brevibacillus sp. HB2.2]NRS52057.1 Ger(x)C family spore germination protein [Brevibacillus sp. HB2.2]
MLKSNCRILFIIVCFLAGCDDQRTIEDLGFIHTVGYDLPEKVTEPGMRRVMLSIPNLEHQKTEKRQVLTAISKGNKEARIKLAQQTDKQLVSGQIRNALFGIDIAKKGLLNYIDTLVRDPAIGPNVKITIVDGSPYEILHKNYPQHKVTGRYIDRLIEKEAQVQSVPEATVYTWSRDFYDDGIDPVAPLIRDAKDHVMISGVALFNEHKYVGKIEQKNGVIFSFLRGDFRRGEISMEVTNEKTKKKEIVLLSSLINKRKIDVIKTNRPTKYKIIMKIAIVGSVLEYDGSLELSDDNQKRSLEKAIAQYIKKTAHNITAYMQQVQADGFGIGTAVRNHSTYEEWKAMKWHEVYSNLEVVHDIEVKIRDFGKLK